MEEEKIGWEIKHKEKGKRGERERREKEERREENEVLYPLSNLFAFFSIHKRSNQSIYDHSSLFLKTQTRALFKIAQNRGK